MVFGHLAEGNVHVNVGPPPTTTGSTRRCCGFADLGEHQRRARSVAKTAWLHLTRDATDRWAMAAVNVDPAGLLNPAAARLSRTA